MRRIFLLTVIFLFLILPAKAKITLPSVLGNHMVLQQNTNAALWGKAEQDSKITVYTSWNKARYKTTVDKDGNWQLLVKTTQAGGPYIIKLSDGENLLLTDVYLGEVWFCSGQSNMEMPVKGFVAQPVNNSLQTIIESEDYPQIRFFTAKQTPAAEPQFNVAGKWDVASIKTTGNFSATAYFFALKLHKRLKVPVGMIHASWGGASIETWMSKETLSQVEEVDLQNINANSKSPQVEPTLLYNGMLMPVSKYTIRGAIWYQGENNKNKPKLYAKLFPLLVKNWRTLFSQTEFPFYYVQITPYKYQGGERLESAYLREVQLKSQYVIPNSGMAVTMDIGSLNSAHPADKQSVGQRLSLIALAKTYGYKLPYKGPEYKSKEIKGNKIVLTFNYADNGLIFKNEQMTGFQISGDSLDFVDAQVKRIAKDRLEIWSDLVANPVHVRYCFKNFAVGTLMNCYGLPASSFRTDEVTLKVVK